MEKIAGEIALSDNPGASLKKWREIFGITQTELARYLKVTPSTISDYEANRRKSPGVNIVKRFTRAICEIDQRKGGWVLKKLQVNKDMDKIFEVIEFGKPISSKEFCKKIEAKVITNKELIEAGKLYGYTIIDSVRAMLEIPADDFIKIYGATTQRALIFTHVSMGRSPMVAIRVTKLKPNLVVMHNLLDIDKLALKISEIEKIPIVSTILSLDEIRNRLEKEFIQG
ncbi:transcriptional regulator [Candidatus Micrarchaeota archaeon]|nr:MAG: transcriptional regulator [Candidatus Micrarchaeota archaeon]